MYSAECWSVNEGCKISLKYVKDIDPETYSEPIIYITDDRKLAFAGKKLGWTEFLKIMNLLDSIDCFDKNVIKYIGKQYADYETNPEKFRRLAPIAYNEIKKKAATDYLLCSD